MHKGVFRQFNIMEESLTMKKAVTLILALVLCFSLCACGTGNGENAIVGTWIRSDGGSVVFSADGTCDFSGTHNKWTYDKDTNSYTVDAEPAFTFTIETENDVRYFDVRGIARYYHADDFDKVVESNE